MIKKCFRGCTALLVVALVAVSAQGQSLSCTEVKDAQGQSVQRTFFVRGTLLTPATAENFLSTSVTFTRPTGAPVTLSSTADGTGGIAVRDFVEVNSTQVCGTQCFGSVTPPLTIGNPVQTALQLIGPLDVTGQIPEGTSSVDIDLFSWNERAGSTPLFLCTTQPPPPDVPLDIKPTSCPNPFNIDRRGVLPAALLGTDTFDVTMVDVTTILLEGVAPLRTSLEDVATPFTPSTGKSDCFEDCNELGPDGFMDLTMKFDAPAIAAALGSVSPGDCVVVTVSAMLLDGTPISAEDVILILASGGGSSSSSSSSSSAKKAK